MSMTDPIADMLTRIRNAVRVNHERVDMPFSKMKEAVADVLKREGFIADYKTAESGRFRMISVWPKYSHLGEPVIQEIHRVSKPGRRVYRGMDDLQSVLGGIGIAIISTSHGVMSDRECRREKVGGEVLCTVW